MTHSTPDDDWPDPTRLVCLVALVATHGLIRLAERYLPAFLLALGYGPILVGLLTTLGLGVAVVAVAYSNEPAGREIADREPTKLAVLATLSAALGLLAWAGAPTFDTLLGTPLTALGWLAVGVVLVQAWHVCSPVHRLWPVDTRIVGAASSVTGHRRTVVGALGVGTAAVFATAVVSSATGVRAGVPLLAAAGAAVALVAAIAVGTVGERPTLGGDRPVPVNAANTTDAAAPKTTATETIHATAETIPSLSAIRRAVETLPDRRTWLVLGDALVRVAIVGTTPYLILLFVDHRPVAFSGGGLTLEPAALFGAFVLAEALGSIVGGFASSALESTLDRRWLLAGGLAVVALLPMAFVAAPASAAVVALLFVAFGCRTAIEPLRPTVGGIARPVGDARTAPDPETNPDRSPVETVRTGVRLALVPAPAIGGLLYAISPVAAFTVATTVGLLGVRELLRALEFDSAT